MALKLGTQTYQILVNDDEVFIPSLSSMYSLSCKPNFDDFFPFSRRLNPKMNSENPHTKDKLAEHHRTLKTKQQKSAKISSALARKQVAFARQVSKRVPL